VVCQSDISEFMFLNFFVHTGHLENEVDQLNVVERAIYTAGYIELTYFSWHCAHVRARDQILVPYGIHLLEYSSHM
jgi:hypothetical protein